MPTKRAVFICFFAGVLLLGAWGSKLVWLYLAFSATVVLLALCYLLSRLSLINLAIERQTPERSSEGEIVTVLITVRNRYRFLDQSVEIEDLFTPGPPQRQSKLIFLNGLAAGTITFSYQERCYKRGRYRIGPFRITVFDPFGLFSLQQDVPIYSTMVVYPQLFPVRQLSFVLGRLAPRFGEQTTRISGDYEEFYGVREYRQEDGWRRIHWRSTARLSELMVRHFELSSQWKAMLVLDANRSLNVGYGKDTAFEYAVKITASLTKFLLYKNASFGLMTAAPGSVCRNIGRGKKHYHTILDFLATVQPEATWSVDQLLARYQAMIAPSSSLIIVTNDAGPGLLRFLQALKIKKNIGIIPVIIDADSFLLDSKAQVNQAKAAVLRKLFSQITTQLYCINRYDELSLSFSESV